MERPQVNWCSPPLFKPLGHISVVSYALALSIYYYKIREDVCVDELRLWIYGQLIIHSWLTFVSFYHIFERDFHPLHQYRGKFVSFVLKLWWVLFAMFLLYSSRACVFRAPLLYWSVGAGAMVMSIFIAIEWKQPRPLAAPPPPPAAPSPPLPVTSFCRDESDKIESCSICIEPFEQDELVSALSCGHLYHSSCINEWLQKTLHCPLCRSPV